MQYTHWLMGTLVYRHSANHIIRTNFSNHQAQCLADGVFHHVVCLD